MKWVYGALMVGLIGLVGCEAAGVKEAYMSLDASGNRRREVFYTDSEAVHCIGKLASGIDDLTVRGTFRARRTYGEHGEVEPVDEVVGWGEVNPGKGEEITVDFELTKTDDPEGPFPAADLVCELALNGELRETVPFRVVYPSCPEAILVSGLRCAGFVRLGTRCDGAGGTVCDCGDTGAWECR